jgi:hypothetical protein
MYWNGKSNIAVITLNYSVLQDNTVILCCTTMLTIKRNITITIAPQIFPYWFLLFLTKMRIAFLTIGNHVGHKTKPLM